MLLSLYMGFLSKAACNDRHIVQYIDDTLILIYSMLHLPFGLDRSAHLVYRPCFTNAFRGSVFTCRLCDVHGLHIRRHISHTTISFELRDTGKTHMEHMLTHHLRSKLCVNYMPPQHGTCLFSDR